MHRAPLLMIALAAACGPTQVGTVTFEISPETPKTGDDIRLTAIVPQPTQTFELTARHDGGELRFTRADADEEAHGFGGRRFSVTIPASETAKGQAWTFDALAADGRKQQLGSLDLTIANTPPTVEVTISPSEATRGDTLIANATTFDADGDEATVSFSWRVNNTETDVTGPEFPAMTARRNDVVTVVAIANDGEDDGPEATAQITLRNSPPTAEVTLTPERPNTTTPLVANATGTDPDGDDLTFSYSWRVNGAEVNPTVRELPAHFFVRDDEVEVTVVARDGRTISAPARDSTTILNSPPTTPVVTIPSRDDTVSTFADIHCRMTTPSTDADRDPITYTFTWYRDDVVYTGDVGTKDHPGDLIPWEVTEADEVWWCSVTATDGTDTSDIAISNEVETVATVEYKVASGGVVNMPTTCSGTTHRYGSSGTSVGVAWNDEGSIRPRRVRIQYRMGVNCGGATTRTAYINDRAIGTAPSGDMGMCTCSPTTYDQDVTFDVPDNYVPGGRNTFTIQRISSDGWSANPDWREGSTDYWAVVTVEY